MASRARRIVQQLHQVDAVQGHSIPKNRRIGKLLQSRRPDPRTTAIKIEFTKSTEVLFPLVNEVRRHHHDDGSSGASNRDAVGDCQRHEGLPHADFVGKDHARLGPQSLENAVDFCPLSLLIGTRHALVQALTEH